MATPVIHPQRALTVFRSSGGGRAIATLPASSRYLGAPLAVPLLATSDDGTWGKVQVPWRTGDVLTGWVALTGVRRSKVSHRVVVDRARRRLQVWRGARLVASMQAGIGAANSPTPSGRYWVTERVRVPVGQRQSFGSFAFGLSGLQPRTPRGWRGKDQLALHGTGDPSSVGRARSAGCVRLSEPDLARLRRWLEPGTPVTIR
jgi:lipoprotein-anchoring transpeptidase ErfK/SrfK